MSVLPITFLMMYIELIINLMFRFFSCIPTIADID